MDASAYLALAIAIISTVALYFLRKTNKTQH
ncbi:hypothetical protein LMG7974_01622 [Campylobacter majalis]|uniref:Uncharacterized protein n=1 Tax=Campylobacter majalis TaxID=2790656 RepID=A0ABN7KBI9_9BACT|nr:hypothetical protein LMG7974_01622 [Campylobacter majalis]